MKISNEATVTKRKLRMTITTTRRTFAKNEGAGEPGGGDGHGKLTAVAVEFLPKLRPATTPLFDISDEATEELK